MSKSEDDLVEDLISAIETIKTNPTIHTINVARYALDDSRQYLKNPQHYEVQIEDAERNLKSKRMIVEDAFKSLPKDPTKEEIDRVEAIVKKNGSSFGIADNDKYTSKITELRLRNSVDNKTKIAAACTLDVAYVNVISEYTNDITSDGIRILEKIVNVSTLEKPAKDSLGLLINSAKKNVAPVKSYLPSLLRKRGGTTCKLVDSYEKVIEDYGQNATLEGILFLEKLVNDSNNLEPQDKKMLGLKINIEKTIAAKTSMTIEKNIAAKPSYMTRMSSMFSRKKVGGTRRTKRKRKTRR
jgi:hypothetical protein